MDVASTGSTDLAARDQVVMMKRPDKIFAQELKGSTVTR